MAKRFACKDLGMRCSFEVSGKDEEEVLRKAEQHARQTHSVKNTDPKIEQEIKAAIVSN